MRYIIIGAGIAGISAAKTIREHDREVELRVFTNELHPFGLVARNAIPDLFAAGKDDEEDFLLEATDHLQAQRISLEYVPEISLYAAQKQLKLPHSARVPFDKLLVATGTTPQIVDVPGVHLLGVHQVYNFDDLSMLHARMAELQQRGAVIIGDHRWAVNMAFAMRQRGIPVILLTENVYVGASYLTSDAAQLLTNRLDRAGIQVLIDSKVSAFLSQDDAVLDAIALADGMQVETALALNMFGYYANTELLEDSDCKLDPDTGRVAVDANLQTGVDGIYAAGTCANVTGLGATNWAMAADQGRVAGLNMAGITTSYRPSAIGDPHGMLGDLPFACVGAEYDPTLQIETLYHDEFGVCQQFMRDGAVVGGLLLGNVPRDVEHHFAANQTVGDAYRAS